MTEGGKERDRGQELRSQELRGQEVEEGSGGVGDLGQTECTEEIWSVVSLTFPPLPQPRASSALWDSRGGESHAAHWGNMACYHVVWVIRISYEGNIKVINK